VNWQIPVSWALKRAGIRLLCAAGAPTIHAMNAPNLTIGRL
jgi:hypothetical protein